jgi:hypothetical protein
MLSEGLVLGANENQKHRDLVLKLAEDSKPGPSG